MMRTQIFGFSFYFILFATHKPHLSSYKSTTSGNPTVRFVRFRTFSLSPDSGNVKVVHTVKRTKVYFNTVERPRNRSFFFVSFLLRTNFVIRRTRVRLQITLALARLSLSVADNFSYSPRTLKSPGHPKTPEVSASGVLLFCFSSVLCRRHYPHIIVFKRFALLELSF